MSSGGDLKGSLGPGTAGGFCDILLVGSSGPGEDLNGPSSDCVYFSSCSLSLPIVRTSGFLELPHYRT